MRRLLLLVGAVALAVGVALGTVQLGTSATDQGLLVFASARAEGDYGASADEFPNLFVLRPDGTGLRRLTTVRVADSDPEWSPDGRRIVFSRSAEPYCHGGLCGISLGSDIWVVDASGKNEKALTSLQSLIPGGEVSSTSPTWSPDGSQVAFDRGSPAGSPQDGIYVVGVNGRGLRHVVDYCGDLDCWGASSLDWSPDGKTLAFVASNERGNRLGLLDLHTGAVTYRGSASGVSWSPDGKTLAVVSNAKLRLLDLSTGTVTNKGPARSASWSPNGRFLAVTRSSGIFVLPAHAGAPERRVVTIAATPKNKKDLSSLRGVSWSPDSRRLAFSAIQPDRANLCGVSLRDPTDIFIVGVDGRGLKRITGNPCADYTPDWRP